VESFREDFITTDNCRWGRRLVPLAPYGRDRPGAEVFEEGDPALLASIVLAGVQCLIAPIQIAALRPKTLGVTFYVQSGLILPIQRGTCSEMLSWPWGGDVTV
jgi:hypothetical protein